MSDPEILPPAVQQRRQVIQRPDLLPVRGGTLDVIVIRYQIRRPGTVLVAVVKSIQHKPIAFGQRIPAGLEPCHVLLRLPETLLQHIDLLNSSDHPVFSGLWIIGARHLLDRQGADACHAGDGKPDNRGQGFTQGVLLRWMPQEDSDPGAGEKRFQICDGNEIQV